MNTHVTVVTAFTFYNNKPGIIFDYSYFSEYRFMSLNVLNTSFIPPKISKLPKLESGSPN